MTRRLSVCGAAMVFSLAVFGCGRKTAPDGTGAEALSRGKVELVNAPAEPVAAFVRSELDKAKARGRTLVVYVGASWCDPCQKFHHAAEAGALDAKLGKYTFVVYDMDRDRERLAHAGYRTQYIPYFVIPADDGAATSRSSSGGIKGEGAVDDLVEKLTAL